MRLLACIILLWAGPAVTGPVPGLPELVEEVSRSVVRILACDATEASDCTLRGVSGTGFKTDNGIVSNGHVVVRSAPDGKPYEQIFVVTRDGRCRAEVIGVDVDRFQGAVRALPQLSASMGGADLALLKADCVKDLPSLKWADGLPRLGDPVVAIGNPLGLGITVTTGVVSAIDRMSDRFIQTDAAINQGNSGGPLVSMEGHVLGVVTATLKSKSGLSFVVPASLAAPLVRQLAEHGHVRHVQLGAKLRGARGRLGLEVEEVFEDGPLQRAGVKSGWTLTHLEDRPLDSPAAIVDVLKRLDAGSPVHLDALDPHGVAHRLLVSFD